MEDDQFKHTYNTAYRQLFGILPPASITIAESDTDIISSGRGFVDAFDFTMQLQVGCPGGCLFCYVASNGRLAPVTIRGIHGQEWGFQIRNKRDVLQKFNEYLLQGDLADKTIYWSGVTDPYATPPAITQNLWRILCDSLPHLRPRRIVIQTRFRPDRDVHVISLYCHTTKPIDQGPPVVVSYSIGTDRNDLIRAWERATPSFEQRIKAIETLCKSGIFTVATLSPFGFWDNLKARLEYFKSWGIPYVTALFFKENTAFANTPIRFLNYLRQEFPLLLDRTWQQERIGEMFEVYGQDRVLIGKLGFTSLANPHLVGLCLR